MTSAEMAEEPDRPQHPAEPPAVRGADMIRRRRRSNLALMAALLGFVLLVYVLAVVKMGGG
jgi:hypothetical protein